MTEEMTTDPNIGQPSGSLGSDTTQGFDFSSALSAEYKDNPSITKFGGDVNKLSKSYLELQSLMGQGRVAIPKDNNDGVAWGLYDKAFGVPDNAADYQLTGEGADLVEFKNLMKQNHISPAVAQKLLDAHLNEFKTYENLKAQQAEQAKQTAEAELKKEWGLKYNENMELARTFCKRCRAIKKNMTISTASSGTMQNL